MKKILTFSLGLLAISFVSAQTVATTAPKTANSASTASTASPAAPATAAVLALKETSFDFGKIPQNRPVTHVFEFTNSGKEPLKLENVQASCGCTTPEWSKDPVEPGASATIKVGYNAAAEGPFTKSVTISYNGNQVKNITISGTVYKAPATSAPANASISLLKPTNH